MSAEKSGMKEQKEFTLPKGTFINIAGARCELLQEVRVRSSDDFIILEVPGVPVPSPDSRSEAPQE